MILFNHINQFLSANFQYKTLGLLFIISGIFDILVGLIVLISDPNSKMNRAFFYITLSAFLWVVGYGMMSIVREMNAVGFWFNLSFLGVPFIASSIFLFSERLIGQDKTTAVSWVG